MVEQGNLAKRKCIYSSPEYDCKKLLGLSSMCDISDSFTHDSPLYPSCSSITLSNNIHFSSKQHVTLTRSHNSIYCNSNQSIAVNTSSNGIHCSGSQLLRVVRSTNGILANSNKYLCSSTPRLVSYDGSDDLIKKMDKYSQPQKSNVSADKATLAQRKHNWPEFIQRLFLKHKPSYEPAQESSHDSCNPSYSSNGICNLKKLKMESSSSVTSQHSVNKKGRMSSVRKKFSLKGLFGWKPSSDTLKSSSDTLKSSSDTLNSSSDTLKSSSDTLNSTKVDNEADQIAQIGFPPIATFMNDDDIDAVSSVNHCIGTGSRSKSVMELEKSSRRKQAECETDTLPHRLSHCSPRLSPQCMTYEYDGQDLSDQCDNFSCEEELPLCMSPHSKLSRLSVLSPTKHFFPLEFGCSHNAVDTSDTSLDHTFVNSDNCVSDLDDTLVPLPSSVLCPEESSSSGGSGMFSPACSKATKNDIVVFASNDSYDSGIQHDSDWTAHHMKEFIRHSQPQGVATCKLSSSLIDEKSSSIVDHCMLSPVDDISAISCQDKLNKVLLPMYENENGQNCPNNQDIRIYQQQCDPVFQSVNSTLSLESLEAMSQPVNTCFNSSCDGQERCQSLLRYQSLPDTFSHYAYPKQQSLLDGCPSHLNHSSDDSELFPDDSHPSHLSAGTLGVTASLSHHPYQEDLLSVEITGMDDNGDAGGCHVQHISSGLHGKSLHPHRRCDVIKEIIRAETEYVRHLRDVAEGYLRQAQKRPEMFSANRLMVIFGNMESIYGFAVQLLADLKDSVDKDNLYMTQFGQCFLKMGDGFEIYSEYCNSHPARCQELRELCCIKRYRHFFEACRLLQGMEEISLEGFLLTPVQKICRYHLQLVELLKYTPSDHPDYRPVMAAVDAMKGVANLMNERKRKTESMETLAQWQTAIDDWQGADIMDNSSEFIYSGELSKISSNGWSQERFFFLFDHQLIYCKKDLLWKNGYVYRGRIDMDHSVVVSVPDGRDWHLGQTVHNAFRIYDQIRDKWFLMVAKSPEVKEQWLRAFANERYCVHEDKENNINIPQHLKQALMSKWKQQHVCSQLKGKRKLSLSSQLLTVEGNNRTLATASSRYSLCSQHGNSLPGHLLPEMVHLMSGRPICKAKKIVSFLVGRNRKPLGNGQ